MEQQPENKIMEIFGLHIYTFIGIILVGIATIFGPFLIQKGNTLKSDASSLKNKKILEEQSNKIETLNQQNSELKNLTQYQNDLLEKQSQLLHKQVEFSERQENRSQLDLKKQFESDFNEYVIIEKKYYVNFGLLSNSKEAYFKLTTQQRYNYYQITKQLIESLLVCKFVSQNPNLLKYWREYFAKELGSLAFMSLYDNDSYPSIGEFKQMNNLKREELHNEILELHKINDKLIEKEVVEIYQKHKR
jgi:hypothetical protein